MSHLIEDWGVSEGWESGLCMLRYRIMVSLSESQKQGIIITSCDCWSYGDISPSGDRYVVDI
ncbi:hypothetical protein [Calothrix sp. 336/3]|uniref:hypothetical protein n=1 Tax=Calothrix sp. 336/3 TaxID=1337936 RepID=UPI000B138983|nr:hypothetical protein [Calothrix sp. 336/3]